MASIHILDGDGTNYRVVCHVTTPAGNNASGISWATALVNSGRITSVLPTGTGSGQITAAELAQIAAGTTLELVVTAPIGSANGNTTEIANMIAIQRAAALTVLQGILKYFGYSA